VESVEYFSKPESCLADNHGSVRSRAKATIRSRSFTTVPGIKIVTPTLVTLYKNASFTTTLVLLVLRTGTSLAPFCDLAGAVLHIFVDFTRYSTLPSHTSTYFMLSSHSAPSTPSINSMNFILILQIL
jgi:hypothetical protein